MDIKEIAPGDTLSYEFDWRGPSPGPWLVAGQTITSHTVTTEGGLTVGASQVVGDKVQVMVSAPADLALGKRCAILCTITASNGEVKSDEMSVIIKR